MYEFRIVSRAQGSDDESQGWGGDSLTLQIMYLGETRFNDWLYVGRPMARAMYNALGSFLVKDAHGR